MLCLTTDPAAAGLEDSILERARAAIGEAGGACGEPSWLAPARACDLPFSDTAPDRALACARMSIGAAPVDVNVVEVAGRRKRLLVADMESTLIRNEMLDELAELVGIGPQIADITRRAMNGEIDFIAALTARVALLAGLPESRLAEAAARIVPMPGARTLIGTMRAHGAHTLIVSGGFRFFAERVRAALSADGAECNDLEIVAGKLTGKVREPVFGREGKLEALRRAAHAHGVASSDTLAVGDGANDLPMLAAAGLGVAFRAKPAVARTIATRIEHADLTALLYLQGYRRDEFVE